MIIPIYNGDGCIRTYLLKHQRTVNILAECNMRGMCIKVKRGPLQDILPEKHDRLKESQRPQKKKIHAKLLPPQYFYWNLLFPSLVIYEFIHVTNPQKNIRLIEIQWRQASAPSLYMALLSVLTLPSGPVMFFPRSSATARDNMHKATARTTKLGFIWSLGTSSAVMGFRSQNLLLKGRAVGKFPEPKTESRKRRSNFQTLRFALAGGCVSNVVFFVKQLVKLGKVSQLANY